MKGLARRLALLVAATMIITVSACDSASVTSPQNVPADHTAKNGGVPHKPGYRTPFVGSSGCTTCHGANLRGGTATIDGLDVPTPSCFSCHGQKWSS